MEYTIVGKGVLNWDRGERITDRYGYVALYESPDSDTECDLDRSLSMRNGKLTAVILQTRESYHIGDLFRGLSPATPESGEEIILGEGILSFIDTYGPRVGLIPTDGRAEDWLDPKALYRCHNQTVELRFIPA